MKEIITVDSIKEIKPIVKSEYPTMRPLHIDFINQKYVVTLVDSEDDPVNSLEAIQLKTISEERNVLVEKLHNNTITFEELKELLKRVIK